MLKALFVTTATSEPVENVRAWAHTMGPAEHITFDLNAPPIDDDILRRARVASPDVIFYTGATDGPGVPDDETLAALRYLAPTVILQGDFADPPWHPVIERYRKNDCFDLYVAMDGVKSSPVDLVDLTPFDPERFTAPPRRRNIRCGFAGNLISRERYDELLSYGLAVDPRSVMMYGLGPLVRVREREVAGEYANYIAFFRRCQLAINSSWAGSGTVHHMKGRILEAGFSGACILEMADSPIADWFPEGSYFTYGSLRGAQNVILHAYDADIAKMAKAFEEYAREHYSAEKIYGRIIARLGL